MRFFTFFTFILFAQPVFAGDPLKKLASDFAELVMELEQLNQPASIDAGPFRVMPSENNGTAMVVSNPKRAEELVLQIQNKFNEIEPWIQETSTIPAEFKSFHRRRSFMHLALFTGTLFMGLSPYILHYWLFKLVALGATGAQFKNIAHHSDISNLSLDYSSHQESWRKELAKNRKTFYEAFRKRLLQLGSTAVLPKWKELGEAQKNICEVLLLKAVNIRLLPAPQNSGETD